MAPIADIVNVEEIEPMSRTYQYRKVMKPMLERKRRARINKCLDDLKELMVGAMQDEGESITKLEKADVLELTVRHLLKLKNLNALKVPAASHSHEKFNLGFRHCTSEVGKFLGAFPGIDMHVSNSLMGHLKGCADRLERVPGVINSNIQSSTPITVSIPSKMYTPPASPNAEPILQHPTPLLKTTASYPQRISPINYQMPPKVVQSIASAPPSPPLSIGSPSPVHHVQSYTSFGPKSPPAVPNAEYHNIVAVGSVWRPW